MFIRPFSFTSSLATIIALILLASIGCDTAEEKEPWECAYDPDPCVLVPLEVGNYWLYNHYWGDGSVMVDSVRKEVLGAEDVVIDGQSIRVYRYGIVPLEIDNRIFAANLDDGLYKMGSVETGDVSWVKELAFPFPGQLGDVGSMDAYMLYEPEAVTVIVELIDLEEELITPAGRFNTIVYRYRFPPTDYELYKGGDVYVYFTPDLGIVAIIVKDRITNAFLHYWLLIDYNIK